MKLPAFQFYPADWRKDPGVQALSRHDRSVWFDILCIMHESDERGVLLLAGKPIPEEALARMLNLDNQTCNQTLSTLLTYGVASQRQSDGAIYSRRMVRDENLIQIRREAGKKGGNPALLKQKSTIGDKQKPTPSSSSSSSSSSSKKIIPPTPQRGNADDLAECIWQHCPKMGRERSSQAQLLAQLKKLPAQVLSNSDHLLESFVAWTRCESWTKDDGQFVPGVHRWVKDGKWQSSPDPASVSHPAPPQAKLEWE